MQTLLLHHSKLTDPACAICRLRRLRRALTVSVCKIIELSRDLSLAESGFALTFAALGSIKFHHSITQEFVRIVQCAYWKPELQVTISVTKQFQSVGIILEKIGAKNADLLLSGTGTDDDFGNRSWLDRKFHSVLLRKGLRELQNLVRLVLIGF